MGVQPVPLGGGNPPIFASNIATLFPADDKAEAHRPGQLVGHALK